MRNIVVSLIKSIKLKLVQYLVKMQQLYTVT